MSFDKNEKDCINGIPLIEIQEKPKLVLLYTGLLSEIKKHAKKGSRTTGINYFIDDSG
jgi:hypothetical protein